MFKYCQFKYSVVSAHCVVANVLDCDIVVSKFKLQLHHYIHFRTNTLEKDMKPPQLSPWAKVK